MVFDTTLSESQKVMHYQLILEDFGYNIQHISGVENIVADIINKLLSTSINSVDTTTIRDQS